MIITQTEMSSRPGRNADNRRRASQGYEGRLEVTDHGYWRPLRYQTHPSYPQPMRYNTDGWFMPQPGTLDERVSTPNGRCTNIFPQPLTYSANQEGYDLFSRAWMCSEGPWSFPYLAIYWLHFRNKQDTKVHSPLFQNDRHLHAEGHLLNHLLLMMSVVNRDQIGSITIMQNASPCWKCSDEYKRALEGLVKDARISISIIFSSFHWIRRTSCREQCHRHQLIHIEKHENNTQGLRKLCDADMTVRTTGYNDWRTLGEALQISPIPVHFGREDIYQTTPRGHEDSNLKYDLDILLS